jgi:hypothetical protein
MVAGRLDRKVSKPHVSFRCSKGAGFGPSLTVCDAVQAVAMINVIVVAFIPD